jgi:hypothetical protein
VTDDEPAGAATSAATTAAPPADDSSKSGEPGNEGSLGIGSLKGEIPNE